MNPFVSITLYWRVALIAYILFYNILTPGLREIIANSSAPLSGARLIVEIVRQVVLFAPVIFYQPRYGWLHPLIFPNIFVIGKAFVKNASGVLLAPLAIGTAPNEVLINPELTGFTARYMAWAHLEHGLLEILSLLCYYGGFFFAQRFTSFDFKPVRLKLSKPRHIKLICLTVVALSAVVSGIYIEMNGGLTEYMYSYFGQGRSGARGEIGGTIFFIGGLGVIGTLVWYAFDGMAWRSPFFWAALAYALPINFFLTGSRSSVFAAAVLFLMVWMMRSQKVPTGRALALSILAVMIVGVMGDFRRSAWKGQMDWDVFLRTSVTDAIERTEEEAGKRGSIQGGAPVVARVPEEVGYLKGESYLSAIFFFVPKFIWENKPRGGGGLNGEIILERGEGGGGVPLGTVAEAYWNFSVPGVISVFFLFGIFHKGLVRTLRRCPHPAMWVFYVVVLTKIVPGGNAFTTGSRDVAAVIVLLFAVGAFVWQKKHSS